MQKMTYRISFVLLVSLMVTVSYADVKWIPIKPINTNESFKQAMNKSKSQPNNKTLENAQVILNLLEHANKVNVKTESKKNWYSLDDMENN
ncbi:MAG: hypothetical protein WA099_01455 [Sulfuricurvum sp.]